ncbi:hypothetical protein [Jatrophihabitans endophyticus]|nr:hypothetical protein [Jatrophihabitans endophyticus]
MTSLVRVSRGVWRDPAAVADLAGRAAALLSVCPPDSVVAGVTATQLRGLWLPPWLTDPTLPIEVIVHCGQDELEARPHSIRPEIRARRQHLRPDEVTTFAALPVVTEARAWVDLAARLGSADLVALGDSVLRGPTGVADLVEMVGRAVRRRGVVRARSVLPYLDGRSRSRPESHLRYAIVTSGLPRPEVNIPIFSDIGEWLAEPDLSYDDVKLALEYQGADHAAVRRMRRDITREMDVEMRGGWRTAEFGPAEVFGRPDQVATRVRRLRMECAALLGRRDPWQR